MLFSPEVDTIEEVLSIRTRAKELLAEGAAVMSWSSEGTSVSKQFTLPIKTVMAETLAFLKTVDPDTYGRHVTRTKAYFC